MRTTDADPQPFRPLGEKVVKPAPAPAPAPRPAGPSGIVTDKDGRKSTTTHVPHLTPLEQAVWSWREHYTAEAVLDFLP